MSSERTARLVNRIAEISAADWDACAGTDNPFVSYAFLSALEDADCAVAETGWAPHHVLLEDKGEVAGVAPMYLKNHSMGEYVFDHSWAHAYEQAGGNYYPKLQMSVPFSPVTGPRLLARDDQGKKELVAAATQICAKSNISSLHITFPTFEDWQLMGEMGLLLRKDQQFIWRNEGYDSFDGFLDALASRKRKNIRKERARAIENDITIEWVSGSDLLERHWDAFFEFYVDTSNRKWGQPYLNRTFFSLLSERMADQVVLMLAKRDGRYIAGALNLKGADALFGRNWGCIEDHPCLHFELCYYQAIDYAIAHGLDRVEAGAQGSHKLARGYLPQFTYSAHYVADEGFHRAIEDFLKREGAYVEADQEALAAHGPFKQVG